MKKIKDKTDIRVRLVNLFLGKFSRQKTLAYKTLLYSFCISLVFAVPIFVAVGNEVLSFGQALVTFLMVNAVAYTAIYLMLNHFNIVVKKEKKFRKVNR